MIKKMLSVVALICLVAGTACAEGKKNPVVTMETSLGNVKIELFEKEAPISVNYFSPRHPRLHGSGRRLHSRSETEANQSTRQK